MKLRPRSLRRIKWYQEHNRENCRIASLAVWPFGSAQFLTFWNHVTFWYGNSPQDDETEANAVFGYISLSQKDVFA